MKMMIMTMTMTTMMMMRLTYALYDSHSKDKF